MAWGIFKKDPLKKLSVSDLKNMELERKVKAEKLADQVAGLEREIQYIFEKSKSVQSRLEEVNLANRIKTLSLQKEQKVAAHTQTEKDIRAVSNMLIIREMESDLKAAGGWKNLEKIPPERLEQYLIDKTLDIEDKRARIKAITDMTSAALAPDEPQDESIQDILNVMREVKSGQLSADLAMGRVSERQSPNYPVPDPDKESEV